MNAWIKSLVLIASVLLLALGYIKRDNNERQREKTNSQELSAISIRGSKRNDFRNIYKPLPNSEWPKVDNLACFDDGTKFEVGRFEHRAPTFMILGAMKAGTTALTDYIKEHSHVVGPNFETHFFDMEFANQELQTAEHGILKNKARRQLSDFYQSRILEGQLKKFKKRKGLVTYDDSPRYLFWSDRIPARVMCVSPWVKLIAVLREPVARAFSHYNMKLWGSTRRHIHGNATLVNVTFEEWIQNDIEDLKETGVLQDQIPAQQFIGSPEMNEAWKKYTRLGTHAPVGRGIYVIQIKQWFEAMKVARKKGSDLLIVNSEQMKAHTDLVYKNVLKFLDLPREPLVDNGKKNKGHYISVIDPKTNQLLRDIYKPFNEELYSLLGTNWGAIWEK